MSKAATVPHRTGQESNMRNRACLVSATTVWFALGVLGMGWPGSGARAGDPPASRDEAVAEKSTAAASRRRCQAQCDSENGLCNSDVRQRRQECSRQAANGGNNPFTGRPEAFDYYCGYFDSAQCRSRRCAERLVLRYAQCVEIMRGDVTARRFNCIRAESKAQALCRTELKDCRLQCP